MNSALGQIEPPEADNSEEEKKPERGDEEGKESRDDSKEEEDNMANEIGEGTILKTEDVRLESAPVALLADATGNDANDGTERRGSTTDETTTSSPKPDVVNDADKGEEDRGDEDGTSGVEEEKEKETGVVDESVEKEEAKDDQTIPDAEP